MIAPPLAPPPLSRTSRALSRSPRQDALIHAMALILGVVLIGISPMALNALGWNYDGLGGSGPTRFHPATYLALPLLLVIALRDGNPLASLGRPFGRDPRLALFLVAWGMLFFHATANQALPAAALVDTFLLPLILLLIVLRLTPATRAKMAWLLHAAFLVNAMLGLGEFATGLRLTPYIAGGVLITDDWRSTALLGHPLGNALLTGCYATILLLGGGQELKGGARLGMIGLQFAAMVAFGGRASLILLLLFGAIALMRALTLFLAGYRLSLKRLTLLAILVPVMLGAIGALYELGVFDKFILRFTEDKGSANARIVMFELFRGFTWSELLLGPPQVNLSYFVHVYRLEFGIESLWVAFSLFYGIIPSVLFFTGLLFFLLALVAQCQKRAWIILGYFFVVNSTFLGIAGKTVSFANLCLILLLLLPKRQTTASRQANSTLQAYPRHPLPC